MVPSIKMIFMLYSHCNDHLWASAQIVFLSKMPFPLKSAVEGPQWWIKNGHKGFATIGQEEAEAESPSRTDLHALAVWLALANRTSENVMQGMFLKST